MELADIRTQPLDLTALQRKLGHRFAEPALLVRALTHRSATGQHNERLEFLGDAVLGYVIGGHLHGTREHLREDNLTLLRASLIRRETLAEVARELGLGEHLVLGNSERRSGGRNRPSVLADALEAVVGAVHEDGGIEAARALIMRLFRERLENLDEPAPKDSKSLLQERLQARGLGLPEYRTVEVSGRPHQRVFNVACEVRQADVSVTATGQSRKEAEKRAAALMIGECERRGI